MASWSSVGSIHQSLNPPHLPLGIYSFTSKKSPLADSPIEISSDEVLRLAFTLQSSSGERLKAEELPHQVVISMSDILDPQLVSSSIISIKPSSGKATWNQVGSRSPEISHFRLFILS
jgi:hypothetical protein